MLLNTIIIVAREVIESALVACLLLVLVSLRGGSLRAIAVGFALGILCAGTYAWGLAEITQWWDFRGQEILGAGVYLLMFGLIVAIVPITSSQIPEQSSRTPSYTLILSLLLALSLTLEISEIGLYLSAYRQDSGSFMALVTGGLIGAGIGLSLAILGYYLLVRLPQQTALRTLRVLFALLAGGLLSQVVVLLMQVDLVPSQPPLWNSSAFLSENAILGQLLIALFRYETQPTLLQLLVYWSGLGIVLVAPALVSKDRALG
jgi:high-affinity iron transporter